MTLDIPIVYAKSPPFLIMAQESRWARFVCLYLCLRGFSVLPSCDQRQSFILSRVNDTMTSSFLENASAADGRLLTHTRRQPRPLP